jgi:hypothetical protein
MDPKQRAHPEREEEETTDRKLRRPYERVSSERFDSLLEAQKQHDASLAGLEASDAPNAAMLGRLFGITRPTKDDVEAIENALSRIPLTISAATQKLLDVKQVRIENLETDNEVLAEKLAEFERTRGELELRLSNAESDIASLRKQIEDLEAR